MHIRKILLWISTLLVGFGFLFDLDFEHMFDPHNLFMLGVFLHLVVLALLSRHHHRDPPQA